MIFYPSTLSFHFTFLFIFIIINQEFNIPPPPPHPAALSFNDPLPGNISDTYFLRLHDKAKEEIVKDKQVSLQPQHHL